MRVVIVTAEERATLERMVRTDPKPYRRERAKAILAVADGAVASHVAESGLLRRRKAETIYAWIDAFEAEGVAGLTQLPGRGRSPAFFSPQVRNAGVGPGGSAAFGAGRAAGVPRVGACSQKPLDARHVARRLALGAAL